MFNDTYIRPNITVEITEPIGFKVSIPDEENLTEFHFYGLLNQNFNPDPTPIKIANLSGIVVMAKRNLWTYINRDTKLKEDDTVYYWFLVIFNNYRTYDQFNKAFKVVRQNGTLAAIDTPCPKTMY